MVNLQQAPMIRHKGVKDRDPRGWGFAHRTHELEAAFACCLGSKDFAMYKVMLFLSGNAPDKFRASEKTVMERCNISESGYKGARQKLVEMGWITHKPGEYIQVNFDKIYEDYRQRSQGCIDKSSCLKSMTKKSQTSQGYSSKQQGDSFEESLMDSSQNTYNNINNNINNRKQNIIRVKVKNGALKKFLLHPPVLCPNGQWIPRKEIRRAEQQFVNWQIETEERIYKKLGWSGSAEDYYERIMRSKEYKDYRIEYQTKKNYLIAKYGEHIRF